MTLKGSIASLSLNITSAQPTVPITSTVLFNIYLLKINKWCVGFKLPALKILYKFFDIKIYYSLLNVLSKLRTEFSKSD